MVLSSSTVRLQRGPFCMMFSSHCPSLETTPTTSSPNGSPCVAHEPAQLQLSRQRDSRLHSSKITHVNLHGGSSSSLLQSYLTARRGHLQTSWLILLPCTALPSVQKSRCMGCLSPTQATVHLEPRDQLPSYQATPAKDLF